MGWRVALDIIPLLWHQMTRTNVAQRLALAVTAATPGMPSLRDRQISPPHDPSHNSDASAGVGGINRGNRPMARTREPDHHASVHAGQPCDEGKGPRKAEGSGHPGRAFPGVGLAARLPEETVIYGKGLKTSDHFVRGALRACPRLTSHNWDLCITLPCRHSSGTR